MAKPRDLIWATISEGGLIFVLGAIAWAARQPLIFASLGPTVYEMVEQPYQRSSRSYNIIVGHLAGLGAGFLALALFHARYHPGVLSSGIVTPQRLGAVVFACALTTFATLALRAAQPAALATTLLISLGAMQTARDAGAIVVGVFLVAALGEPLRRYHMRRTPVPGSGPTVV